MSDISLGSAGESLGALSAIPVEQRVSDVWASLTDTLAALPGLCCHLSARAIHFPIVNFVAMPHSSVREGAGIQKALAMSLQTGSLRFLNEDLAPAV